VTCAKLDEDSVADCIGRVTGERKRSKGGSEVGKETWNLVEKNEGGVILTRTGGKRNNYETQCGGRGGSFSGVGA